MPDYTPCCEHQYRRDIETCPYCELNEAEAQVEAMTKERDEARALVLEIGLRLRDYYRRMNDGWYPEVVGEIYQMIDAQPWLKEEACIQLENDAARRVE